MKSVFEKEEAYWTAKFDAEDSISFLPYGPSSNKSNSMNPANHAGAVRRMLPQELSARIQSLAKGSDMAVYMILLAGVNALLSTYANQEHVLVGMPACPAFNADNPPVHDVLIIKNKVSGESTFKTLLGEVKASVIGALEHQRLPFRKMIQGLNLHFSPAGQPVFNTIVSLANLHTDAFATSVAADAVWRFESAAEGALALDLSFDEQRYEQEFMDRAVDHFFRLLSIVLFQPDLALGQVDLLSEAEKHQLCVLFNDTATNRYPQNKALFSVFEEQAERTPDRLAVVFKDNRLTYGELNERANRIARVLRAEGVTADRPVAMLMERSVEMIVGMLAVLKAGGAYVPIDPQHPEDRIRFVLEDSGADLLLTQARWADKVDFRGKTLCLDDTGLYDSPAEDGLNLEPVSGANNLAYLIYTSGTTGKPKGVMIEQRSVVNFTLSLFEPIYAAYPEYRNMAQLAPYVFDMSVKPIYGALLLGRTLHIVPEETRLDGEKLLKFFREHEIDITDATPTFLSVLVQAAQGAGGEAGAKHYVVGGEALTTKVVRAVWSTFGEQVKITNVYGPTECTVDSTIYEVSPERLAELTDTVPIGKPLPNQKLWILDSRQRLLPVGVAGELHISGAGVARGYNRRLELTAEKFVANPHDPGERMYKTGDLARWLPDGNIEYLGRIDHQVKIRGFRIELGEVEAQLLKLEPVQEAIVLAREDDSGQKQLCAYFVAVRPLTVSELRGALSQEMPAYMIPAHFIQLDRLPLTTNGKVDRRALPAPEGDIDTGTEYVAPRTAQEAQLARIWKEVLGLEKVGAKDNFFVLGGHSLNLMQLIQRVYTETGVELPIHKVFQNPTVESMAYEIWESGQDGDGGSRFVKLNGEGPLNVFCFPPGSGYGFAYLELAKRLEGHCTLHVIDFIDDAETKESLAERYVDEVIRIQDQSPYILLGYSVGGNLMFEVAEAMEKGGCRVSDLIIVDSLIRRNATDPTPVEELENDIEDILGLVEGLDEGATGNPLIRERMERKIRAYLSYGSELVNTGTVTANIHALFTEEVNAVRSRYPVASWREGTRQSYSEYNIAGPHAKVLHPEYVEENSKVFLRILRQISGHTNEVQEVLN